MPQRLGETFEKWCLKRKLIDFSEATPP